MYPEVQASMIIVAGEWAVQLTKVQTPSRRDYIDRLVTNFRAAYSSMLQVVEEIVATGD